MVNWCSSYIPRARRRSRERASLRSIGAPLLGGNPPGLPLLTVVRAARLYARRRRRRTVPRASTTRIPASPPPALQPAVTGPVDAPPLPLPLPPPCSGATLTWIFAVDICCVPSIATTLTSCVPAAS